MAFTDKLTKFLGLKLPEPEHNAFETLYYQNQHLLDCILNSMNSENRLVAGSYNSGSGQLEGIRVKFVFGGAVSLVDFPDTAVSIVTTHQIWCANRLSGTITAIDLTDYAQMIITADDFPILYTGHHVDSHVTTAPFSRIIAPLNHNTQEQIRLNNPKVNEDVALTATSSDIDKIKNAGGTNPGDIVDTDSPQTLSNKSFNTIIPYSAGLGGLIPVAIASIKASAEIVSSIGVVSCTRPHTGIYYIHLTVPIVDPNSFVIQATIQYANDIKGFLHAGIHPAHDYISVFVKTQNNITKEFDNNNWDFYLAVYKIS